MRFIRFGLAMCLGGSGVVLGLCAFLAPGSARAVDYCTNDTCLPNGGYTYNQTWDCGVVTFPDVCYFNSTTRRSSASAHTWGFGSASYPGTGNVDVCVDDYNLRGTFQWGSCALNRARACARLDCRDVDGVSTVLGVSPSTTTHTVNGHGEA
jgi:hypothetical protein